MKIARIKNFITQAECDALNAWVDEAAEKKWMDVGRDFYGSWNQANRLTTRVYGDRFVYPDLVKDIRDRIAKAMGLTAFPLILDHGKDGVVVSRTDVAADIYPHRDPRSFSGDLTLRCNILTRKPSIGGELYIERDLIDIDVCELHCYAASEHIHSVSAVKSGPSRVLWMFGAYVPEGFWE